MPAASGSVVGDLLYELTPERSLDDLLLPRLVRAEIRRSVEEQQRAELLRLYGMAPRHRLQLVGPPGNGKTNIAYGLAVDTRTPYLLEFAAADGGKNAHYLLRWINPTGEKGPWSETASVTIGA